MRKPIIVLGVLLISSIALGAWFVYATYIAMPSIGVDDVQQVQTLVLGKKTGNAHPHGISIHGTGEIEGDATVSLMLNGQPYKVARLQGRVDFEWGGDWYSETAEIRYEPANVRSGNVVLHYRFYQ